ncbi:MAG TPA: chemotaxis protein CheA [Candidatus Aquilonibacter sp.]|nr:chemotaxis protein CheA [Candidatus Aquilonibacter sp.]
MSDAEIVKDFLVESYENLDRLDRDLVELEKKPQDHEALAGVFRTIHTIKGTCGFLGFGKLEKVAHVGENLLSRLRDGHLVLNPEITTALLGMVDAVRQMLKEIETTGADGEIDYAQLREELTRLQEPGAEIQKVKPATKKAEKADVPPVVAATVEQTAGNGEVQSGTQSGTKNHRSEPVRPVPRSTESSAVRAAEESDGPKNVQAAGGQASASESTVRVQVGLLDKVMTLVGELVLARNQVLQYTGRVQDAGFLAASQRLNLITTELQEGIMKTRMQPIGNIWGQLPRTVRDVALGCGKKVKIEMEGKETELDKTIIEAIKDPLTHLVRNSVDHGIELPEDRVKNGKDATGRLVLRAFHEGGQVNIEISDDGGGLNADRIRKKAVERAVVSAEQVARMSEQEIFNLIFLPGFSTAEKITNVSGRGVGMDVVKTNVERIGGSVGVQSTAGQGTTVRVKIPLTLAIVPALVVTCAGERYAIPQLSLVELVRLEGEKASRSVEWVHGAPVYRLRGRLLPLLYLDRELGVAAQSNGETGETGAVNIVVLQADERQFGLVVDQISDTEEIVVKPLRKQLKGIKTFAGSTIMGDGKVALILDVLGLAQRASVVNQSRERPAAEKTTESAHEVAEKQTFLLFAGPGDSRMAIPLSTLARLEEFPVAQVEMSGSQWVTQYRGQILPLIRLGVLMEERRARLRALQGSLPATDSGPIQVLVLNHEGRSYGLVVEQILDIVQDRAEVKSAATRESVLYSVVIAERVTELLDIASIVRRADLNTSTANAVRAGGAN